MAELKDRLDDEEKLLAILLFIFASEPQTFWLTGNPSPYWFLEKIQNTDLRKVVDNVSFRAAQGMLKEIQVDIGDLDEAIQETRTPPPGVNVPIDLPGDDKPLVDPSPEPKPRNRTRDGLLNRLRTVSQVYELELANRLHRIFREWQDEVADKQAEGEPVEEEIYPEHRAEAEAITQTTGFVSQSEMITAAFVKGFLHVQVAAQWATEMDGRQCVVCGALDGKWQTEWMLQFPQGPPAHVRCRCGIFWFRQTENRSEQSRLSGELNPRVG
jgi:hypothetical protein